jgi:hypothetical protein
MLALGNDEQLCPDEEVTARTTALDHLTRRLHLRVNLLACRDSEL